MSVKYPCYQAEAFRFSPPAYGKEVDRSKAVQELFPVRSNEQAESVDADDRFFIFLQGVYSYRQAKQWYDNK